MSGAVKNLFYLLFTIIIPKLIHVFNISVQLLDIMAEEEYPDTCPSDHLSEWQKKMRMPGMLNKS